MEINKTSIEGLLIINPKIYEDDRGYFYEIYNRKSYQNEGIVDDFVQDNISLSKKNVLRGLHFQKPPYTQVKLIRVIKGKVLDVAVDLRLSSKTYGRHCKVELSESNGKMFYIPSGFAHGFLTMEDDTIFSYKCSNVYNKDSEDAIYWNDQILNIDWGIDNPILSPKDMEAQHFDNFNSPF